MADYVKVTGTLSFPHFKDKQYHDEDVNKERGKYGCNVVLDGDTTEIQKLVIEKAMEAYGAGAKELIKNDKVKVPLKKATSFINDDGERYQGYEGDGLVAACTFYDPMIFKDQFGNSIESDSEQAYKAFYPGAKVKVAVVCQFKTHSSGNKFGQFILVGLLKTDDGERIGGGVSAQDADELWGDEKFKEPDITPAATSSSVENDSLFD